jgi:diguanylate cyclase (GGDEF)-like protein/PAS domain S-box-containing protein
VSVAFEPGWLLRVVQATEADLAKLEPQEPLFEIAKLRALFRTAFSHAPIGLAVVEQSQTITVANDALCSLVDEPAARLVGQRMDTLIAPEHRELERDGRDRVLSGELPCWVSDLELLRHDGSLAWVRMTVAVDGQEPASLIYQLEDIAERRRHQAQLEHLVDHDPLTGVFNRRRFDQELEGEVARSARSGASRCAVLTLDLDGFKAINDGFGHQVGDDLLRGIAEALSARSRQADVLARIGGDEFGLLLRDATPESAEHVAAGVAATVAAHELRINDQAVRVSASIGVAMLRALSAAEVIVLADAAMYQAKAVGNHVVMATDPDL